MKKSCDDKDIRFTLRLLKDNPKNYWIIHHYKHLLKVLKIDPTPIIDAALDKDPRNFHFWTFKYSTGLDLEFTRKKLVENFSNFSAWHYRSHLVQDVLGDLDWVKHAIYTEPSDQAAWLYQRFLLGTDVEPLRPIECLVFRKEVLIIRWNHAVFVDHPSINFGYASHTSICSIKSILDSTNTSLDDFSLRLDSFVCREMQDSLIVTISGKIERDFVKLDIQCTSTKGKVSQPEHVWRQELHAVQELDEFESSKWTKLTLAYIYIHLKEPRKAILMYSDLIKLDPFRERYYIHQMDSINSRHDQTSEITDVSIDMSSKQLAKFDGSGMYLKTDINLSNNIFTDASFCRFFQSCITLNLDDNKIQRFPFRLVNLQTLSLKRNRIRHLFNVVSSEKLTVYLEGNPIDREDTK